MIAGDAAKERVGWQTAFLLLCSCAPTVAERQSGPVTSEPGMPNVRLEGTASGSWRGDPRDDPHPMRWLQRFVDHYAERLRNEPDKPTILGEMQGRLDMWCTIEVVEGTLRVTQWPISAFLGGILVAEAKIW